MTDNRIYLAIESATSQGSVAVGGPAGLLAEVSLGSPVRGKGGLRAGPASHSSAIVPAIDYAVSAAGLQQADLAGVVVGSGPGSFTGIRTAGATAKSIAHALDLPLFAFSSLLVAAAGSARSGSTICAMFDARGRDVFAACYRFDQTLQTLVPPTPMTLDEAIAACRAEGVELVTGDAILRHGDELERETGAGVAPIHLCHPRAGSLLWLVSREPGHGEVVDRAAWEPDYLRPSGAERIAEQKAAASADPKS